MGGDALLWKEVAWPAASMSSFAELPAETKFVESCSHNAAFDKEAVYVPAQMADNSMAILRVDVSGNSPAEVFMHFKKGNTESAHLYPTMSNHDVLDDELAAEAMPFGSALASDGLLYVCVFNKNLVVVCDLKARRVVHKIQVPAPNDVCVDDNRPGEAFVACGVWMNLGEVGVTPGGHLSMAVQSSQKWRTVNPTEGSVQRITIKGDQASTEVVAKDTKASTEVVAKDTKALAGIGVSQGKLWMSMLINIDAVPLTSLAPTLKPDKKENRVWAGYDAKLAYLVDNVAMYDQSRIILPCYRSLWRPLAKLSENKCFAYLGFLGAKACTGCIKKASANPDEVFSAEDYAVDFTDPSVAPELHEGDSFPHLHFVVVNTASKKSANTRILLPKAMVEKGAAADFDGHVTHVEHVGGKLVCVNFLKKRLLILSDSVLGGNVP